MIQHSCPRCRQQISGERLRIHPVVCNSCGLVASDSQREVENTLESSSLKAIIVTSAVILLSFMQLANWGNYAIEVIPLKVGDWVGNNSVKSKERLAEIALDLNKHDLVERMYREIAKINPTQLTRLGKFQMSRAKYKEAAETFGAVVAINKKNLEARYDYARCLGESGKIDEAMAHYDFVLKSKPGVLQVTVLENYIKHLVAANRLEQAKRVIESVQRSNSSVSQFMDARLKTIVEKINSKG